MKKNYKQKIEKEYKEKQYLYNSFSSEVSNILKQFLIGNELRFQSILNRAKEIQKLSEKISRKKADGKQYKKLSDVEDLAGVRLVFYLESDKKQFLNIFYNEFKDSIISVDDKYNPRKIIRMILLGMRDKVLASDFVWLCSTCYTCRERCPQDVKLSDIMTAVRNIAVKEGHINPAYLRQLELINTQGKLYEIDEFDNRRRERAGLPPLPMKNEHAGKILEATGLSELVVSRGGS